MLSFSIHKFLLLVFQTFAQYNFQMALLLPQLFVHLPRKIIQFWGRSQASSLIHAWHEKKLKGVPMAYPTE